MADQSFFVHLQSLFDFANELQTQLTGMTAPADRLSTLATTPVLLGDFGEAHTLGASHQAAVAEISELLGQVQQAIGIPGRIDDQTFACGRAADQIHEILHRADGHLPEVQIARLCHVTTSRRRCPRRCTMMHAFPGTGDRAREA